VVHLKDYMLVAVMEGLITASASYTVTSKHQHQFGYHIPSNVPSLCLNLQPSQAKNLFDT
jgi:hypothetical protein